MFIDLDKFKGTKRMISCQVSKVISKANCEGDGLLVYFFSFFQSLFHPIFPEEINT